jgi:hypothetical protein
LAEELLIANFEGLYMMLNAFYFLLPWQTFAFVGSVFSMIGNAAYFLVLLCKFENENSVYF